MLEHAEKFKLFEKYDKLVQKLSTESQYFSFWKAKKALRLPFNFLSKYLNHQVERYIELVQWVTQENITKNIAIKLLILNIEQTTYIDDRFKFYRVFYSLKFLFEIEPNSLELIEPIENEFVSLILWHLKIKDRFNFETLKGKFIYFKPEDQVYIFKRLFYLKNKGEIEFDLYKLDEIIRADVDLYLVNKKFNNDFILDISTHIIIECLKSFTETNNFLFESDLILKDLKNNSKQKFKIKQYFDLCEGRLTPTWDWNTNGKISQIFYNEDKFYYAISFKTGRNVNPKTFEYLKDKVNKLPNINWNKNEKHWEILSIYKDEVYAFARDNKFFINLVNKRHYNNNIHLVEFTRNIIEGKRITEVKNIPNGIIFCEGRKANIKHRTLNKEFWWCTNQECFQNCVSDNLSKNLNSEITKDLWEEYTLLDFLKILKINTDEQNHNDFIKNGHYYKFLGHINAFNRLLEHLYCEKCNNLLYPIKSSHFALHRNVRFHCIEQDCSEKHNEIYLNNCLYGECTTIIDSRVSMRCQNGLFICPKCGTCCSNELFQRRLESLKKVGGKIYQNLINNVKNQNGHLEKSEYYCYKCSQMMTEMNSNKYKCLKCEVKYDFNKFKWLKRKWTQTYRRREDYPVKDN